MKTLYITLSILIFALLINSTASLSQVDINKKINMTGGINDDRRITNVGDVTATADAVNAQTLQKGSLIYIDIVAGSANAITASTTPSFTPQAGSTITFKAASANTASVTLNVNGAGAFPVYKNNTEQLILNDIKSGQIITATFDGSNWQIGGGDNLGNHQATQNITANANNAYDIGNSTNSFKDGYFTGVIKLDNATFLSNDGSTNTFVGETQNTSNSGGNNTFVGYRAGNANTTGDYNTFLGLGTGQSITVGTYNTFLGAQAGLFANMSYSNLIGYQTAINSTGGYNNIMGYQAAYNNTSGAYSEIIGYQANFANTTGWCNQILGYQAAYNNQYGSFNSIMGYLANYLNTSGSYNCYIGLYSGYNNTNWDNVAVGAYSNYTGNVSNSVLLGYFADASTNLTNVISIGNSAFVSSSNTAVIGNSAITKFGIGVTPSAANIMQFSATTARLTTGGVWTNASDRNIKENFKNIDGRIVLQKLEKLPITSWNYIKESKDIQHIGPMAQDFYKLFQLGNDSTTISTIDPSGISLAAIKELDKKDKELEAKQKELEIKTNEIEKLKAEVELNKIQTESLAQELRELKILIQANNKQAMKQHKK